MQFAQIVIGPIMVNTPTHVISSNNIRVLLYGTYKRDTFQVSKVTEINYLQKYIDFPIYFRIAFYYDWSLLHHQSVSAEKHINLS